LTTQDLVEASRRQVLRIPAEPPAANQARADYQSDLRPSEVRAVDYDGDSRTIDVDVANQPAVVNAGWNTAAAARAKLEEELGPLFPPQEANDLRSRWDSVQGRFVDEPRKAVEDADVLIASTMKRLAEIFAAERQKLEQQWDRGGDVSTEDLRLGLRRYRSFFTRLLKV
jgi:hypothetical protein